MLILFSFHGLSVATACHSPEVRSLKWQKSRDSHGRRLVKPSPDDIHEKRPLEDEMWPERQSLEAISLSFPLPEACYLDEKLEKGRGEASQVALHASHVERTCGCTFLGIERPSNPGPRLEPIREARRNDLRAEWKLERAISPRGPDYVTTLRLEEVRSLHHPKGGCR